MVSKPGCATVTVKDLHVSAGANENSPALDESAEYTSPVAWLVAFTFAESTTAPESSVITPLIPPRKVCAKVVTVSNRPAKAIDGTRFIFASDWISRSDRMVREREATSLQAVRRDHQWVNCSRKVPAGPIEICYALNRAHHRPLFPLVGLHASGSGRLMLNFSL